MDNTVQLTQTMPRRKNDGSKIISVYMSPELHQSVKLAATFDGMTMQDWVVSSLIETLKQRPEITLPIASQGDDNNGSHLGEGEGHKETNGHHAPQQVKVVKPRKHHKTYRDKVGELVGELAGNQVKVSFDGEEKAFYSDEIELVETE